MLANDFVCGVPFQHARARIPGRNISACIQHENRVVFDGVQQRPVCFVAISLLVACAGFGPLLGVTDVLRLQDHVNHCWAVENRRQS